MKKILAVLLAVSLLLGISCSAAEEQAETGNFWQSLTGWAQTLNLDESDYYGAVSWNNTPVYEGTIRKDQDLLELAVSGLGRAQISDKKIMLDIGGQKYGVDLSKIMEMIQSFFAEKKAASKERVKILPWLEKAFRKIILPSVKIHYSLGGLSVHIDADDETIKERTYELIDELMTERKTAESLLSRYGSFLGRFIPGMPRTFEELEKIWEAEKTNQALCWRDFKISADITYSQRFSGLSVSGRANLYFEGLFGADVSLELKSDREGIDLLASLDLSDGPGGLRGSSYKLAFHSAGDKTEGMLQIRDHTYMLKAERKTEENGSSRYTASLTGLNRRNEILMEYDLDAVLDPDGKSFRAGLYETRDAGTPEETRVKLGGLDVFKGVLGWEAELQQPFGNLSLNLDFGDQYSRLKLEHTGAGRNDNWFLDIWLYYSRDEYLIRAETNLFNLRDGVYTRNPCTYSLALRKHEIEYSVSDERETKCHAKLSYRPMRNGFEAEAEYMNLWAPNATFNTRKIPSRVKFVKDGDRYSVGLEWSREGRTVLSATGTYDPAETGGFGKLGIDATYDPWESGKPLSYQLTATPEAVTLADRTGIYELRIAEDTTDRLAIRLTKNDKLEMGSVVLTIDDQGAFKGVLTVLGFEMGSVVIKPIPKEPITEITK